jgi:hypothetical protein
VRGSPVWRALFAFLAILALGYPLARLTSADEQSTAQAVAVQRAATRPITLQITFTTPPRDFVVQHLGKAVWSAKDGAAQAEQTLQLPYPKEGVELHFTAGFPAGATLAAARLVLTDPDGDEHVKSCWGTGQIDEVVTFP